MGTAPVPAPDSHDTATWPTEGTVDFPDGRHLRIAQDNQGARPQWFLTETGEETEREVEGDELAALIAEANKL